MSDDGKAVEDGLEVVCFEYHYFLYFVDLFAEDVHLGYDPQRSLPADEEMLQVVAGVVLVDLRTKVQDLPVWGDRLEAQDVCPESTVLDDVLAACVGRNVSADEAGPFRAQVEGGLYSIGFEVLVESFEDDARFAVDDGCYWAVCLDFVHVFEVDDYLIENRDASADKAGVSALGDDRKASIIAMGQYLGDLVGSGG